VTNSIATRQIWITTFDLKRLNALLSDISQLPKKGSLDLSLLEAELDRANIVQPSEIPTTVVTMNTQLRFRDLENGDVSEVTLVFPCDADIDEGKMSIFSPIGTSLLGYSQGDTIEWPVPGGVRRIKIEAILFQPEAAGNFDL